MRRVMIIGCCGAGKSTLARQLGEQTSLPVFHLDKTFWKPDWTESPDEEFAANHDALLANDRWIIDGNYSRTMEKRLELADTVIFLDLPRLVCMFSIFKRYWSGRGQTRPDMTEGCPEKLDWPFIKWAWSYKKRSRPKQVELANSLRGTKVVHVFTSRKQIREWLNKRMEINT